MTEIVIDCINNQFPKDCPCCGRRFSTLSRYLRQTDHVDAPVSHDANMGRWRPRHPFGTQSLLSCPCGATLAIGTERMPLATMWRLLQWARVETRKRNLTTSQLLESLRNEIDRRVLSASCADRQCPEL